MGAWRCPCHTDRRRELSQASTTFTLGRATYQDNRHGPFFDAQTLPRKASFLSFRGATARHGTLIGSLIWPFTTRPLLGNDSSAYRASVPPSSQLIYRYLGGFDVQFEAESLDIARSYRPRASAVPPGDSRRKGHRRDPASALSQSGDVCTADAGRPGGLGSSIRQYSFFPKRRSPREEVVQPLHLTATKHRVWVRQMTHGFVVCAVGLS